MTEQDKALTNGDPRVVCNICTNRVYTFTALMWPMDVDIIDSDYHVTNTLAYTFPLVVCATCAPELPREAASGSLILGGQNARV